MSPRARNAPVFFVDVDGVINALGPVPDVHAHRYASTVLDIREGAARFNPHIRWQSSVVARINALHRSGAVQVVWLTTWFDHACTELAPAIGLDDFEVIADPEPACVWPKRYTKHPDPTLARTWWKTACVREFLAGTGRPYIWADDALTGDEQVSIRSTFHQPSLLIAPVPALGLGPEHMELVEAFVEGHTRGR